MKKRRKTEEQQTETTVTPELTGEAIVEAALETATVTTETPTEETAELVLNEETTEASAETESTEASADAAPKITDEGEIIQALEAIVFASPKAMSLVRLRNLLNSFNYDTTNLSERLGKLEAKYADAGMQLIKVAGGWQFRSHPKCSDLLQKLLEDKPARLSASALEVLAIVGYKQPVTRAEIDSVRGIDSGHLMKGLLEKNLVRTAGHAETPGRPLLYTTTPYFLEVFSLHSLDDLPAMDEMNRELVKNDVGGANAESDEGVLLAADPELADAAAFLTGNSPLAANPDRGAFDAPAEDAVENADFGLQERAREEALN